MFPSPPESRPSAKNGSAGMLKYVCCALPASLT